MSDRGPILTLEPLADAIRDGVESVGWELSGLQKTTSHEFEGRWAGESTRSAYLFFHRKDDDHVSVDVFLDETSRGLRGNLALVMDLIDPDQLPPTPDVLAALGRLAATHLPEGYRTPVTLRYRLSDGDTPSGEADVEARIKLSIPGAALEAGTSAVAALASATVKAFESVLADRVADRLLMR